MSIHYYKNDLPDDLTLDGDIAVDTETQGLNLHRDRLCLIQLSAGDGVALYQKNSMGSLMLRPDIDNVMLIS